MTLAQWLSLHPASLIMQPDSASRDKYSASFDYETGASRKALTGTDTISWNDKAWVVGVSLNGESKAYDWKQLRRERALNDVVVERRSSSRSRPTASASSRSSDLTRRFRCAAIARVRRGTRCGAGAKASSRRQEWHSCERFAPSGTRRRGSSDASGARNTASVRVDDRGNCWHSSSTSSSMRAHQAHPASSRLRASRMEQPTATVSTSSRATRCRVGRSVCAPAPDRALSHAACRCSARRSSSGQPPSLQPGATTDRRCRRQVGHRRSIPSNTALQIR